MDISQRLCEVRDKEYDGKQWKMARGWEMHEATLSRWIRGDRIPDPSRYNLLAEKLGETVNEIHRLCMADRDRKIVREASPLAS